MQDPCGTFEEALEKDGEVADKVNISLHELQREGQEKGWGAGGCLEG